MIAALALLLVLTVAAAEPTETLTLACEGTVRIEEQPEAKPEPYSMGMTIDFTARMVQGFGFEYPFKITNMNAATIIFRHTDEMSDVLGHIDQVTGDLEAQITWWLDRQRLKISNTQVHEMKCKPT
jgi:hypothetical protein